uniref:Ig-like domain-containing protein n=1 Tax=Pygocentrus nattereri TaxID=42514 RepID=A0A3B4CKR5_PYGNA
MIGLLVFSLCFFETVKSSDIVDLQVQTVRRGDNTTIKCHQNETKHDLLTWYQQSLGKLPQYIVRPIKTEEQKVNHTFSKKFENSSFTVDTETFDLSINGVKEEDVRIYFCGKGEKNSSEFLSGTLLLFAGNCAHTFTVITVIVV